MTPEPNQDDLSPAPVPKRSTDIAQDDYFGLCPSCEERGELNGDCEIYDGDEEPAADLEMPAGAASNRRYRELWECSACGTSWDEVFVYLGREPR